VYLVLEVAYYTWELVRVVFWFMNYHSSKLVLLTVCYFALTDVSLLSMVWVLMVVMAIFFDYFR
jgi:hypothetical protein